MFFGITQGLMWTFILKNYGFTLKDWEFYSVLIPGVILFAVLYHKCKH